MANYINIAALQFQKNSEYNLATDTTESILQQFQLATERLSGTSIDLVVTCEGMESAGQTIEQAESYEAPGPLMNAYSDFAKANKCCVVGSTKLLDKENIYNAQVIFGQQGEVLGDYRKVFLTNGEATKGMVRGEDAKVIKTPAGRIGGAICFDLNFTELRDSYKQQTPDILAFSSMFHGGLMQQEWAFHCRSFFAASCKDGASRILDPLGREVATTTFYGLFARARINLDRFMFHGDMNSDKIPDLYRKYGNDIHIDRDPCLGVGILYSETETRSAQEIADEFGMIQIDDYFAKARKNHSKLS